MNTSSLQIEPKKAVLHFVEPPISKVSGANFSERRPAAKSYQLASSGTGAGTANHVRRRWAASGRIAGTWVCWRMRSHSTFHYSSRRSLSDRRTPDFPHPESLGIPVLTFRSSSRSHTYRIRGHLSLCSHRSQIAGCH